MGVRAGQGYGQTKPKRRRCPDCQKQGVTQWRATGAGLMRYCQYCQMSWGEASWKIATGVKDHTTHPYKVESWLRSGSRAALLGRALFKTETEAATYAAIDEGPNLPVRKTLPGDVEFA